MGDSRNDDLLQKILATLASGEEGGPGGPDVTNALLAQILLELQKIEDNTRTGPPQ